MGCIRRGMVQGVSLSYISNTYAVAEFFYVLFKLRFSWKIRTKEVSTESWALIKAFQISTFWQLVSNVKAVLQKRVKWFKTSNPLFQNKISIDPSVTHASTNHDQRCLTSQIDWDWMHPMWYGPRRQQSNTSLINNTYAVAEIFYVLFITAFFLENFGQKKYLQKAEH